MRSGRLAVRELKTKEDPDLPLLDDGSRIRCHQESGDLARYDDFPGVQLQLAAPLVYAPALRFHPFTDVLLNFCARKWKSSA
jgi:hypothetical protein